MKEAIYYITTLILWICIGLNCWAMIRNIRLSKMYADAIAGLRKAKDNCDECAQRMNDALDALQKEGVGAALAVFEKEDAE